MLQRGGERAGGLPGSDQRRGAGRDAEPHPHHDAAEVENALAEQADRRRASARYPAPQPAPGRDEEHRRRGGRARRTARPSGVAAGALRVPSSAPMKPELQAATSARPATTSMVRDLGSKGP